MTNKHHEFHEAITRAVADTPYVVVPTEDGFEVNLDIANARWYGAFNKAGLEYDYSCRVTVSEDSFKIVQGTRKVSWTAGVPSHGSVEWSSGRIYGFEFNKSWALDESFRPAQVIDYSFSPNESLALVRAVGQQLGLTEKRPASVTGAIVFAGLGASALVIVPVAFLGRALGWW